MKKIQKISIYIVSLALFVLPIVILAQNSTPPPGPPLVINIPNPTNVGNSIMEVITALLERVVMPIAAVAAVIFIVWSGFSFLTAQGKPAEIAKAKQRLLWAMIGTGILLGAAGISAVVQRTITGLLTP